MIDQKSLILFDSGEQICKPLQLWGPAERDFFLMHAIVSGTGLFQTDHGTYSVMSGQAFFVFPDETTFYQADEFTPWFYAWTGWQAEGTAEFLADIDVTPEHPILDLGAYADRIVASLRRICHSATYQTTNRVSKQELMHLFTLLKESRSSSRTASPELHYKRAMYLIEQEKSSAPYTVDTLAEGVGLSRSQLYRVFMQICGASPKDVLIRSRCERAIRMIRETELTLDLVATACCFHDATHLCSTLRRTGYNPPSSYRRKSVPRVKL